MKFNFRYLIASIVTLLIVGFVLISKFDPFNFFGSTFQEYDFTPDVEELSTDPINTELEIADLETKFEVIADDLEIPWGIVFLDNNELLVTERTGLVQHVNADGNKSVALDLSQVVVAEGESGLMSMVKDPDFEENSYIYLYHSYDRSTIKLRIDKYVYSNGLLTDKETVIENIPAGQFHSSGEMAFGPDGKLYITTGDAADRDLAQQTDTLAGKTLRINSDGSVPLDNPFTNDENTLNEIWTMGHRNAQGLDWHPVTGEMYQSEHGPSGFDGGTGQDEINLVQSGKNYGWPIIRGIETQAGLETPLVEFTPALAPGSIVFYTGDMFPEYENHLFVAGLRGRTILILSVDRTDVEVVGNLVDDSYGRIREIQVADDGSIYFTTSNRDGRGDVTDGDDKIIRIYR